MSIPVIQGNQGKLNKDLEPAYVTNGDYLDAQNVRYFTRDGQTEGSHENIIGNEYAFDIGDVSAQNKKYKVCGLGPASGGNSGWTPFGTPQSQLFVNKQTYDPHIIEDTITPGDLWMSSGYDIWYYDSALATWTEMTSMVVATGIAYKSVRLTMSSTGTLACVYVKDFGSGNRYMVMEWNGSSWIPLMSALVGFEAASGYTFGNYTGFEYGAYFDPQLKYNSAGNLFLYILGVYVDNTQPSTSIFYNNRCLPRVFRYNTSTSIWNDISGSSSTWNVVGANGSWGGISSTSKKLKLGNIIEYGNDLYFPMVYLDNFTPGLGNPYYATPYIARYDYSLTQWNELMSLSLVSVGGGGRMVTSSIDSSTANNIFSWGEPTIRTAFVNQILLCFGIQTSSNSGSFYVYVNSGPTSTSFSQLINPTGYLSALPSLSYVNGKCAMEVDSSSNIIISIPDAQVGNKLTAIKYNTSTLAYSFYDVQGFSSYSIDSQESDLLYTSTNVLYTSYSDYTNAASYSVYIGIPTVQRYIGGGSSNTQNFSFFYNNGISIGNITGVNTVSGFQSQLASIFPPSKYDVVLNTYQSTNGTYCIEFEIRPLISSLTGGPLGFNYYIKTSGIFTLSVIQDPICLADSGEFKVIGSTNIQDDLFILSTPNERPAVSENEYMSSSVTSSAYGLVIYIDKNNDIPDSSYVRINNSVNNIQYSGIHLCSIDTSSNPSFDIITLPGYFPSSAPPSLITVKAVSIGAGQIGVATKDENSGTWNYTSLLQSIEFCLSTLTQADMIGEQNNRGVSIYWTDNYNPPRSFYYYGDYVTNGGLNSVNSLNKYILGGISSQIRLQIAYGGATISYGGQGTGRLNSGNYRYSVRFVTKEGVTTNWSVLSQPFTVYEVQIDPYKIKGGDSNSQSGKSNILLVNWDTNSSYDYIEFAYTRLIPAADIATNLLSTEITKFGRTKLSVGQASITYEHDGFEVDIQTEYPVAELQKLPFIIKKAKNMRSLDNRLVLSNINLDDNNRDLTDLFDLVTYELDKKAIPICGTYSPTGLTQRNNVGEVSYLNVKSLTAEEYMNPENVFYYTGYMLDETYRFYGVAEFIDGTLSDAYYLFDVKFDTNQTSSDLKRTGSFTDYTINDGPAGDCLKDVANVYVPYIKVQLPSILPTINGVSASEIIKKIHIYRADVKQKTVLSNGVGLLSANATQANLVTGDYPAFGDTTYASNGTALFMGLRGNEQSLGLYADYWPYPFIADESSSSQYSAFAQGDYGNSLPTYGLAPATNTRNIITHLSQDQILSDDRISYQLGDQIINYGHYDNYYRHFDGVPIGGFSDVSYFASLYHNAVVSPQIVNLDSSVVDTPVKWCNEYQSLKFQQTVGSAFKYYTKIFWVRLANTLSTYINNLQSIPSGHVFWSASNINTIGRPAARNTLDYGMANISYYRPLTPIQQYGEKSIGYAIPTGAYLDLVNSETQLGPAPGSNTIDVFGGDTFTCKSLLKFRFANNDINLSFPSTGTSDSFKQMGINGVGMEFYSQSRVNPQLRYNSQDEDPNRSNYIWPFDFSTPSDADEFWRWFNPNVIDSIGAGRTADFNEISSYNQSYSDKNLINTIPIYNDEIYYESKLPATIYYSEPKLQESLSDSYAYISPTNRKDLDITLGPIYHHEIANGELITFQEKAVQRQFFNTTAMFADATSQIVMGDGGAVLSRKGFTLSTYGIVNKWGVVKGRSQGGNDVLYWFDAINKKIFRFGADGIVPISTRGNIDSFLANFTNFIQLHDTPANDQGIHGVWDESNNEAIFTFRARKGGINYDQAFGTTTGYSDGDIVYYNGNITNENYDWHETGEFWESLDDSNVALPTQLIPPPPGNLWQHIPHSNPTYYNEFTIVYSEDKNGFTTFYTPKPKIYLPYKDRYLSPRPISTESEVYEHGFGVECVWYDDGINPLQDVAYIEGIVNYNPEIVKTAEAVSIDAYTQPYLVEVRTQDHDTFMDSASFQLAESMYRSPVKNDTLGGTVTPDGDTSRPYGRWIALKYIMQFGYKQAIRTFVMKVRPRNRMYNK